MKYLKYITFMILCGIVMSCEEDEFTNDSTVVPTNPTISVTGAIGAQAAVTDENDTEYTFTITLSEPQVVDIIIHLTQTGGSAIEGEDYEMDSKVVIPYATTTATATLIILGDLVAEEQETLAIQIGDERTGNANLTPVNASFTIDDYVPPPSPELTIDMSWSMDVNFNDEDVYDLVDWDFFVFPAGWSSFGEEVTGFAAATGDPGESATLSMDDLDDGVYEIWVDLWDAFDPGDLKPVHIPITFTFNREFSSIINVELSSADDAYTTDQSDVSGDGSTFGLFATVEILNGEYIIRDATDNLIIQGRLKELFPQKERVEIIRGIKSL